MSTSISTSPAVALHDERVVLRRFSWLFFTLGLVSILVGILAIAAPHVATEKALLFIGVLLVIAGATEVVHGVMVRNLRGFAMHLLAAALYLLVGIFVLEDPDRAGNVLTLLLVAFFLVGGMFRVIFALVEQFPAWPWVLFNGVVDLFLGVLIWRGWPGTGDWVIGLFVGIELLLHGWSWVILAITARMVRSDLPA
jgi:uncharacterized membrane protein HdeD (DUF308 family)